MVTVWKIAPGEGASVWEDCRQRSCITINWLNGKDFSLFRNKREVRRALIKVDPRDGIRGAPSIWQFTREVRQGDVVVANDGLSRVVGIGMVTSGYLPPDHPRNPNRQQDYHRHARLVDWLVDKPIDLGKQLFIRPTVQRLDPEQCRVIVRAYRREEPKLGETLDDLFGHHSTQRRLGPAADESESNYDSEYIAPDGDLREAAWQQIKKRRGQPQFRRDLLQRYGKRCLVTGCKVAAALEGAHIDPYRGKGNNHPANGLLLRADIHTLFDLNLLGIEPNHLRVELHPDIAETYGELVRKTLGCAGNRRPLQEALKRRYAAFQRRRRWPA
jgi:hypothetical protein